MRLDVEFDPIECATSADMRPPAAEEILEAIAQLGLERSVVGAALQLIEKAQRQAEMTRVRSMKGALGQKAAADSRRRHWVSIAQQLMAGRQVPFASYRALATAVAKNSNTPDAEETIRKHLAQARVLDMQSSG